MRMLFINIRLLLGCCMIIATSNASFAKICADTAPTILPIISERFIHGSFQYFNIDAVGNVYAIKTNGQLVKYNPLGDSMAAYNDIKRFGIPQYIDVKNPMKIRLFYQSSGFIITLDQLLTFRNQINLRALGLTNISAIAQSYDDNIWIFDTRDYALKKINESGKMILEGDDLRQLTESTPEPQYMTETDDQVVFYDSQSGFYLFNFYGRYNNRLAFLDWNHPAIIGKLLIGCYHQQLRMYELQSLQENIYALPILLKEVSSLKWGKDKIYALHKEGIQIFKFESKQ